MKPTAEESTRLMSEIRDIKEAVHGGAPVSGILRRAWEAAHKAQSPEMESWIKSELRGYAQNEKTPVCRWVYAKPERHLWDDRYVHYPLDSNIPGARDRICRIDVRLSVTEIENCLSRGLVSLRFPVRPADLEKFSIVDPILYKKVEIVWTVPSDDFQKMVDAARDRVFDWCSEIESSRSGDATGTQKSPPQPGLSAEGSLRNPNPTNFVGEAPAMKIETGRGITTENTSRPAEMIDIDQYDAIVFGVYGTLLSHIDFKETMIRRFGKKDGETLFLRWRREHERAIFNCAQRSGYGDYFALARNAFRTGIGHEGEQQIEDALMKLYHYPPMYKDAQTALDSPRHRVVLAVTNAPRKHAGMSLRNANVHLLLKPEELSSGLISAEDVSSFMPNADVYRLIQKRADVPPRKVLVLTDSVYVAYGAVRAGMGTVLVKRTSDPHDDANTGQFPVVSGLHDLFRYL